MTQKEDLVSVIMPTYNCGAFIKKTIESVMNQTFGNWELIVVDDCSNDNTESVLDVYQEAIDNKYRFYSYGDCMFINN